MKTLFALLIVLASCSSDDPEPQVSCSQLKSDIQLVTNQIESHYAKGSEGDQSAWEKELSRLLALKSEKVNESTRRACP